MGEVPARMAVTVRPYPWGNWGPECYSVTSNHDFDQICRWMQDNDVRYWQVSSGNGHIVFQLKSDPLLFRLTWTS